MHSFVYASMLGLSDSENNIITIVMRDCEHYHDSVLSIHKYHDYKQKGIRLSTTAHGVEYRSCFVLFH